MSAQVSPLHFVSSFMSIVQMRFCIPLLLPLHRWSEEPIPSSNLNSQVSVSNRAYTKEA